MTPSHIAKTEKEYFQANMLDGDEVQDGQMISSEAVLEYVTERVQDRTRDLIERVEEGLPEELETGTERDFKLHIRKLRCLSCYLLEEQSSSHPHKINSLKYEKRKTIDAVDEWLHKNCKKGEFLLVQSSPNTLVIMKNAVFAYKDVSKKKICSRMLGCKNGKHEKLCPLFGDKLNKKKRKV